jgi:hypothetical protein
LQTVPLKCLAAQSTVFNLFDVKAERGQFIEVMLCNKALTGFCTRPSEIAKFRFGCARAKTIHFYRQSHDGCAITRLKCDS